MGWQLKFGPDQQNILTDPLLFFPYVLKLILIYILFAPFHEQIVKQIRVHTDTQKCIASLNKTYNLKGFNMRKNVFNYDFLKYSLPSNILFCKGSHQKKKSPNSGTFIFLVTHPTSILKKYLI